MKLNESQLDFVASTAHTINKMYCEALGDMSQPEWENAPEWQKQSARNGVLFLIDNKEAPLSASHDSWMKEKVDAGWVYGDVKDPDKKEHPCIVPYDDLPAHQKFKDLLFRLSVVSTLSSMMD